MKKWFPENMVFDLSENHGEKLTDSISNIYRLFIVSEKLKNVLGNTGEEFEFFPVKIRNHEKKIIDSPYYLANLLGSLACLDKEQSEYVINPMNTDRAMYFSKLVLDETKIPKGKKIFRLKEFPELLIVNESLAIANRVFLS